MGSGDFKGNTSLSLRKTIRPLLAALFAGCCLAGAAAASEDATSAPYSGELLSRSTLTGDWGGGRNKMASKGVTIDLNFTQTSQGVVSGGRHSNWEYGGRGDLIFKLDTGKMGLWPGGFLTTEVEGLFGHGVNLDNGGLMPVNSNQLYPVPGDEGVAIPAVNFAQFLSEKFGVVAGKLNTVATGDMNDFAHGTYGKGDTQFMNLAFNVNPVLLMTVPYSTLGTSMIILPTGDPHAAVVSLGVLSSTGEADTTGFDTLNKNRLTFVGEARLRTDFLGMSGHQLLGYAYSNKEFTSMDQRLGINKFSNSVATEKGSWALFYNFDQYLYEPVKGSGKGFGVFGRFGAADGNPNPVNYFFSLGVGGKGVIPGRQHDRFGVGWYFIDVKSPSFSLAVVTKELFRDEQGLEAFYSIALTPWALLTPDIQVVHGAQKQTVSLVAANRDEVNTATILGLRLQLLF